MLFSNPEDQSLYPLFRNVVCRIPEDRWLFDHRYFDFMQTWVYEEVTFLIMFHALTDRFIKKLYVPAVRFSSFNQFPCFQAVMNRL